MENRENIIINLIKYAENLQIDDAVVPIGFANGEITVFFANCHKKDTNYQSIIRIIEKNENCNDILQYFDKTLEELKSKFNDVIADIILIDTHNSYLNNKKKNSITTKKIVDKLKKTFNTLMNFGFTYAKMAYQFNNDESQYFKYALTFKAFGGFDGDVLYAVYPVKINNKLVLCDVYGIKSSDAAMLFDLASIAKERLNIKICENCGKYFLPTTRSDEIYCDNEFKNGRTCKQMGYENKVSNDEYLKVYRTAYKTQHAKMLRNSHNKPDYKKEVFDVWVKEAKAMKENAQNGVNTLEEFKHWLNVK